MLSSLNPNPNDGGEPLPVFVRLYQLRSKEKFEQAPFAALGGKDDKTFLDGDLVDRKEITVLPSSTMVLDVDVEVKKGAEYLGVMALFRKPTANWKQIIYAKTSSWRLMAKKWRLKLDQYTITVED